MVEIVGINRVLVGVSSWLILEHYIDPTRIFLPPIPDPTLDTPTNGLGLNHVASGTRKRRKTIKEREGIPGRKAIITHALACAPALRDGSCCESSNYCTQRLGVSSYLSSFENGCLFFLKVVVRVLLSPFLEDCDPPFCPFSLLRHVNGRRRRQA